MLKHDLENEQHSNQLLRDELLAANEKLQNVATIQRQRQQDGLIPE